MNRKSRGKARNRQNPDLSPSRSRKRNLDTTASTKEEECDDESETHYSPEMPVRDCKHLFVSPVTLNCAQIHQCVPCGYKIGCYDVALDAEFTKTVPNQRPEQCPRRSSSAVLLPDGTMGYWQGMNVLTVGDGDMSFSLALARRLLGSSSSSSSSTVIGTSYEDKLTLVNTYPNFEENVTELEKLGAKLYYKVDATRLKETLPTLDKKFHRICWNFPCTAIANGQDGQNDAMERNKDLVRKFMGCAIQLLESRGGEIHMCHKTKPPYNQWKLERVALENTLQDEDIHYMGKVVLDRYLLPSYTPRKALDRKSFPCHDACFYIFKKEGKSSKFPPTIDIDPSSNNASSSSAVSVTSDLILSIRNSLMLTTTANSNKSKRNKRGKKW